MSLSQDSGSAGSETMGLCKDSRVRKANSVAIIAKPLGPCKLSGVRQPPNLLRLFCHGQRGGVIAMIVLFLPVAVLSIGMVADLGLLFVSRKLVQSACDLGALAGCQELDWDLLAQGLVVISDEHGKATAVEIAWDNLRDMNNVIRDVRLNVTVINHVQEPRVLVEADFRVQTFFIRYLPGFRTGIPCFIQSESAVVERKKW